MTIIRPHELNQSNLRFLVKNSLLNNSHLERFNSVCTPFPMERHIWKKEFFAVFFVDYLLLSRLQQNKCEGECFLSIGNSPSYLFRGTSDVPVSIQWAQDIYLWRSIRRRVQKVSPNLLKLLKKVNLSKWLLLRSIFFTKNLKFNCFNNSCGRTTRFDKKHTIQQ